MARSSDALFDMWADGAAFCQSESVSTGTFYHWQARLRQRGFVVVKPHARRQAPAAFIEVGAIAKANLAAHSVVPNIPMEQEGRFDIKLDLGNGVVLHLARR
jgi:hypothetical protein